MKLSNSKKLFSYGNIFSYKPQFNVNGSNGYHSLFSFCFSFIFYIIFLVMVIYFSQDWLYQLNPQVSYSNKSFEKEGTIDEIFANGIQIWKRYMLSGNATEILKKANLTLENFFTFQIRFGDIIMERNLTFQNPYGGYLKNSNDYRILPDSTFKVKQFNNNDTVKEINYTKLSEIKFVSDHFEFGYRNLLDDYYLARELNYKINQTYSEIKYYGDFVYFDASEKTGFKNESNPYPYKHSDRGNYNYDKYFEDTYKRIKLNEIEVQDNRGDIFSKKTTKRKFNSELIGKDKYNGYYSGFYKLFEIKINRKSEVFIRKYKKLQNVFADVGGILSSLILISKMISDMFNIRFFNYEVINLLFDYDCNNEIRNKINNDLELKNINKDKSQIDASSNRDLIMRRLEQPAEIRNRSASMPCEEIKYKSVIENNNNNDIINNNHNFEKERLKKEIETIKENHFITRGNKLIFKKDNEKNFINMTNKEFTKLFIPFNKCKRSEELLKEKIFKFGEDKISQYLNVFNFFDLQEDFEKLRMIILNKFQNSFFDFIKKRTFEEMSGDKYFDDLIESIIHFKGNNKDYDFVDKRIMENVNELLEKLTQ